MSKPILVLDFDGVLHSYTSGWKGADVIPDPPVPGAMRFLVDAMSAFDVAIFSSRSNQDGGIEAMEDWLWKHLDEHFRGKGSSDVDGETALVMSELQFPTVKPAAFLTIDDRAITFTGTFPDIETLRSFKPWNKA